MFNQDSNAFYDDLCDLPPSDVFANLDGLDAKPVEDAFAEIQSPPVPTVPLAMKPETLVSEPVVGVPLVSESVVGAKRGCDESSEESDAEAGPAKKLKRGEHVKGRTEMQENARSGQRHWAAKVPELRREWEEKEVGRFDPQFGRQLWLCERLRVKPQRECLLLAWQLMAADGVIVPFAFSDAHNSLGWTGFWVVAERSSEFRARMATVFASDAKSTTINNTFRRAGLVAEGSWDRAWRGLSPFVYNYQLTH